MRVRIRLTCGWRGKRSGRDFDYRIASPRGRPRIRAPDPPVSDIVMVSGAGGAFVLFEGWAPLVQVDDEPHRDEPKDGHHQRQSERVLDAGPRVSSCDASRYGGDMGCFAAMNIRAAA